MNTITIRKLYIFTFSALLTLLSLVSCDSNVDSYQPTGNDSMPKITYFSPLGDTVLNDRTISFIIVTNTFRRDQTVLDWRFSDGFAQLTKNDSQQFTYTFPYGKALSYAIYIRDTASNVLYDSVKGTVILDSNYIDIQDLQAYTICKFAFQSKLINCESDTENINYVWSQGTINYPIVWKHDTLSCTRNFHDKQEWIDPNGGAQSWRKVTDDYRYITAYLSLGGHTMRNVQFYRDYKYTENQLHVQSEDNLEEYGVVSDVSLSSINKDSLVYFIDLSKNREKIDSISYHYYGFMNGYQGNVRSCGVSWINNPSSFARITLLKK